MECQKKVLVVLFGICLSAMILVHAEVQLTNIAAVCGRPEDTVVETDPIKHGYLPYMIKVPRCRGTFKGFKPTIKRCVPSSSVNVSYRARNTFSGLSEVISVIKHTRCFGECVQSKTSCNKFQDWNSFSCQCKCRYPSQPPPNACPYPQVWKQNKCDCGCPMFPTACPARKEWDEDVCGCTCKKVHLNRCLNKEKMVNQENCRCVKIDNKTAAAAARGSCDQCKDVVQNKIVVMIVVIEFLALLFIFFLVYRCCLRHIADLDPDRSSLPRRMKYEMKTIHGTFRKITKKGNKGQGTQPADKEFNENGVSPAIREEPDNQSNGNLHYEMQEPKYLTSSSDHEEPVGFYPDAYDTYGSDTVANPDDWYEEIIGEERSPLKESVSMESGQVTQV